MNISLKLDGEYGEGDQFAGIQMPSIRSAIKHYLDMSLLGINEMLYHEIHEFRMAALLILGHQYKQRSVSTRRNMCFLFET